MASSNRHGWTSSAGFLVCWQQSNGAVFKNQAQITHTRHTMSCITSLSLSFDFITLEMKPNENQVLEEATNNPLLKIWWRVSDLQDIFQGNLFQQMKFSPHLSGCKISFIKSTLSSNHSTALIFLPNSSPYILNAKTLWHSALWSSTTDGFWISAGLPHWQTP